MNAIPKRKGRPEMTPQEREAMYRLSRTQDGKVVLDRLRIIRERTIHRQLQSTGEVSEKMKGRALEIADILQEFEDVDNYYARKREPKKDNSARFR